MLGPNSCEQQLSLHVKTKPETTCLLCSGDKDELPELSVPGCFNFTPRCEPAPGHDFQPLLVSVCPTTHEVTRTIKAQFPLFSPDLCRRRRFLSLLQLFWPPRRPAWSRLLRPSRGQWHESLPKNFSTSNWPRHKVWPADAQQQEPQPVRPVHWTLNSTSKRTFPPFHELVT